MNIYLKKLDPEAKLPIKGTLYAGAWDVTAVDVTEIEPGYVVCKFGFALQLPVGHRLIVQPRSNLARTGWIMPNSPGIGDADYFGEYTMYFRAFPTLEQNTAGIYLAYPKFPYKAGDRIGQCYLERIIDTEFIEVDELNIIGNRKPVDHAGTTGL